MYVIKRSGKKEAVKFDKITSRIQKLMWGLDTRHVDPVTIAKSVIQGIYDGVHTTELDQLASETAANMATVHPDYAQLAARIAVSNLHKTTRKSFSKTIKHLYDYKDPKTGENAALISETTYKVVMANADRLDSAIIYDRDFGYDYFGFKTLERSYLLKTDGKIAERPQHMLMRVAIGIHGEDIDAALETYDLMSQKWFTHATPTLFNAGTPKPQLSSCFLLSMQDDSIEGIFSTLKQCAEISQSAGGIGLSIHNIRATGSYIKGTNGTSNGIVPMLRVFNDTARYVDQGGGKRKGAFAVYLEPWHADIFDFLDLRKNHGKEEMRARDLFYSLWIPDLFMQRVKEAGTWSLMCPNECPGLYDCHGAEFEALYTKYENEGRARKTVKARDLWTAILDSQVETGTPYMLFKDHANHKSNQQNLGTIRSSNLCTEIIEYTSKDEVAVCNLASLALPKYVRIDEETGERTYDHQRLYEVTKVVTRNLNKIIDINWYPVPQAEKSNFRHRPIGIGVQGLADAFILMRFPFDSEEARQLNRDIFETLYYAAMEASVELAAELGTYASYDGSPLQQGKLQFDLWGVDESSLSGRWNWQALRSKIAEHGARNSLLLAPMPTASTSQILGNNECFEPYTSNLYTRRVLSGEFVVVNKHLLRDLIERGLWTEQLKHRLMAANGSVQNLDIPADLKELYKTSWEIKQKVLLDLAAERGPFICQSQSLNVFVESPNYSKLSSMHFYAWERGLKTGMYYLRTQAATDAIKFTVDKAMLADPVAGNTPEAREAKRSTPTERAAALNTHLKGEPEPAPTLATPTAPQSEPTAYLDGTQPVAAIRPEDLNADACRLDDPDCESCSG